MNNDMFRRDALIRKVECHKVHTDQECETDRQWAIGFNAGIDRALFTLIHAPVVNIEPVRHARWLPTNDDNKKRCSGCDVIHLIAQYPHGQANYCPNCGAKMDAEV